MEETTLITNNKDNLLRSASSSVRLLPPTQEELDSYEESLLQNKENELKLKETLISNISPKYSPNLEFEEEEEIIQDFSNSIFDVTKLRESATLGEKPSEDLLRASDLRASQLRNSQITNKINSTNEFISQKSLTQSQQLKMQLYLGDLQQMRQRIVELLQSDDGEDESLNVSLLSLLDKIDQSVEVNQIDLNIQTPFTSSDLDNFPSLDNNFNNDNNNNNNDNNDNFNNNDSNTITVTQLLQIGVDNINNCNNNNSDNENNSDEENEVINDEINNDKDNNDNNIGNQHFVHKISKNKIKVNKII